MSAEALTVRDEYPPVPQEYIAQALSPQIAEVWGVLAGNMIVWQVANGCTSVMTDGNAADIDLVKHFLDKGVAGLVMTELEPETVAYFAPLQRKLKAALGEEPAHTGTMNFSLDNHPFDIELPSELAPEVVQRIEGQREAVAELLGVAPTDPEVATWFMTPQVVVPLQAERKVNVQMRPIDMVQNDLSGDYLALISRMEQSAQGTFS